MKGTYHHTEEWKRKVSEKLKGRIVSQSTREKISQANMGEKHPMWGKHHTEETRRKMSISHIGREQHSEETRRKISEANKGKKHPMFGKHQSEETRKKISENGSGKGMKGKHHTEETKEKISKIRIERGRSVGKNNPNWKGGASFGQYCIKFNENFKERVRAFFDYQCAECGTPQNGKKLDVHHVNFNKNSCCDSSSPLFVALCHPCHAKSQFRREFWEQHFTDMINNYYGGKCYLTKEEMVIAL